MVLVFMQAGEFNGVVVDEDWSSNAIKNLKKEEYSPSVQDMDHKGEPFAKARLHFVNRNQNLRIYFDEEGMELMPREFDEKAFFSMVCSYGVIDGEAGEWDIDKSQNPRIINNKIIRRWQKVTEEYSNGLEGLSENIIINEAPENDGSIVIRKILRTGNCAITQPTVNSIHISGNGMDIAYRIINAKDASSTDLNCSFRLERNGHLEIVIDNEQVCYPVRVSISIVSKGMHAEGFPSHDGERRSVITEWPIADWAEPCPGTQLGGAFGYSVATAGDVNGDGYSDVVIGAYLFDHGQSDEGVVYVYHGSSSGLPSSYNWYAEPNQEYARFGHSVACAGDVDNDGYSDIIIGAPYFDHNGYTDEGLTFVYCGSDTGLPDHSSWWTEILQSYAYFGYSVACAGYVNGDGCSDVIIGAPGAEYQSSKQGLAYVYEGSIYGLPPSYYWRGELGFGQTDAKIGYSVASAGDVNNDGYSDIIVGAPLYDNGSTDEGIAMVYHGSISGLPSSFDWYGEGNQEDAAYGVSVSSAGDVNGDGYSDVIVGAPGYDNGHTDEGVALLYYGSSTGLGTYIWYADPDQSYSEFGLSVACAGDFNNDGYSDVIIGAPMMDNGSTDEGCVFMYYGSASGLPQHSSWMAESNSAGADFGHSVGTAGDVNGDGISDIIIGAHNLDGEGWAYVYHGTAQSVEEAPDDDSSEWSVRVWPTVSSEVFTIAYSVPGNCMAPVSINVYTMSGRLIQTIDESNKHCGSYTAYWHGKDNQGRPVPSGVYFLELKVGAHTETSKLLLMK